MNLLYREINNSNELPQIIERLDQAGEGPEGVYLPVKDLEARTERKAKALEYGSVTILFIIPGIII